MSLILEALKKLERDKPVEGRSGFLVMASRPWPTGEGRTLFIASLTLAGLGLGALTLAGLWWWRHTPRVVVVPVAAAPAAARVAPPAPTATLRVVAEAQAPAKVEAPPPVVRTAAPAPVHAIENRPPLATPAPAATTIRLAAISERDGRPVAIVNDRLVFEGDSVDGIKVVRIGGNEVEVEIDGHRQVVQF